MMTFIKPIFAVSALALVAGCATTEITTPPVAYTATKSLNAVGQTVIEVRTYKQEAGSQRELSGVPCTFQGDGFRSSFVSPAKVIAPNMQERTPVASVTCSYEGESKSATLAPFNQTTDGNVAAGMAAGAGAGVVGVLVGAAVGGIQNAARDASRDVYGYQSPVQIVFK